MTPFQLRRAIFDEQKQELRETFKYKWEKNDLHTFQFLSANLSKCMPNLNVEEHKSVYFDVLSCRVLQHIDIQFSDQFNTLDDVNEFNYDEIKKNLPALFVSYHLGSFRSALAFLVKYNIDVVLIADPLAYKVNYEKMMTQYEMTIKAFNSTSKLIIYPADKQDLTVQIMGKMGKGYSVLAYIDGNSGVNGYYNRDNSQRISFMGQDIFVRTGLPTLSFYLKCPIVPMVSFYDEDLKPRWKIHEPIFPVKGERKPDDYVKNSTIYLYGILEKALEKYYAQWEGWMFLHRYIDTDNFTKTVHVEAPEPSISDMVINPNVGLFTADDKHYALNKENYKLLEITNDMFISFDKRIPEKLNNTPQSDINFLYKNGFLKIKSTQATC